MTVPGKEEMRQGFCCLNVCAISSNAGKSLLLRLGCSCSWSSFQNEWPARSAEGGGDSLRGPLGTVSLPAPGLVEDVSPATD